MAITRRDNEVACTTINLSRHLPQYGWVRACVTREGDWRVDPAAELDEQKRAVLQELIALRCVLAEEPVYTRTPLLYWVFRASFAFGEVRDSEWPGQVPGINFPQLPPCAKY